MPGRFCVLTVGVPGCPRSWGFWKMTAPIPAADAKTFVSGHSASGRDAHKWAPRLRQFMARLTEESA